MGGYFDDKKLSLKKTRDKTSDPSPPPEYRAQQSAEDDLVASVRKLNLAKANNAANLMSHSLPSNDECIAHLKLLAAFANLREEVSETDGLFDLTDELALRSSGDRNQHLIKIREKRWAVYVTRAVDRFEAWWQTCVPETPLGRGVDGRICMDDILQPGNFQNVVSQAQPLNWTSTRLPPLDVLMVLHSFMLNPRNFLEDCVRHGRLSIWHAGFPWALVNESIDDKFFEYSAPNEIEAFISKTGRQWDNLQDSAKVLRCSNCQNTTQWPYTIPPTAIDDAHPFEDCKGFADKAFEATCKSCNDRITHDSLVMAKFRSDVNSLLQYKTPMPGTILSLDGIPESAKSLDPAKHEVFFPNRLILAGLHKELLGPIKPDMNDSIRARLQGLDSVPQFDGIRRVIEIGLRDRSLVTKANKKTFSTSLLRAEKIAIRRMMSRYWENSSPFALNLVGAVLRQGTFVEKMKGLDWIHSPALESTVRRLVKKYSNFFRIMSENPGHIAVPTLDVDLAWHTHQLSPSYYYAYAVAQCKGNFVDHDDKIEESKLSSAFEWTSKRYQKLTGGEVYSECTCWYCEAIRESHNHQSRMSSGPTSAAKNNALALHDRTDINGNPEKNAHISAHNAVRTNSSVGARIAARQQYKLEQDYAKAVRRAKSAGKSPPGRDEYQTAYVWGYPMYMPGYFPYFASASITGGMYPCNPAGIATGVAAVGSCAAGTCGAGVAAGGCASTAGGCGGGGAGGGCGGGSGGGGGCGGGGGGCGGGGGA